MCSIGWMRVNRSSWLVMTDANLVNPGNANNQIGIDCWTGIMTGIINGEPVLSTFDDTYAFGLSYIGAGASGVQVDGLTVGFDNLTVSDNGNLTFGPETPAPPADPTLGAPPLDETGQMGADSRSACRSGRHIVRCVRCLVGDVPSGLGAVRREGAPV